MSIYPYALIAFALYSLADLRMRVVPAVEAFFLGAVLLAAGDGDLLHLALMVSASAFGLFAAIPAVFGLLLLFYPAAWPVLAFGFGVRRGLFGKADLLAMAGVSILFPWTVVVFSLLGVAVWSRWWLRRGEGAPVPLLPGMFLGLLIGAMFQWMFR